MKKLNCFILVFVFASVISAYSLTHTSQLENEILSLLNKWREGEVHTNLFPLPSLKKINIHTIDGNYEGKGINMVFSTGDMSLTGLDDFSVEYLNVTQTLSDIRISAKLFVPLLTLSSENYNIKGRAYFFYPLQGHGKMTILFRNVDVSFSVEFGTVAGNSVKIDDFSLDYNINSISATLEKSSWPITEVLDLEGVSIIAGYHTEIVNATWSYAVPYANHYLAGITPGDFLKIISDISVNSYVVKGKAK